ncbi:MAG: hypothetical protein WDA09_10170 [Bacteriovoracaceae bacterium]
MERNLLDGDSTSQPLKKIRKNGCGIKTILTSEGTYVGIRTEEYTSMNPPSYSASDKNETTLEGQHDSFYEQRSVPTNDPRQDFLYNLDKQYLKLVSSWEVSSTKEKEMIYDMLKLLDRKREEVVSRK